MNNPSFKLFKPLNKFVSAVKTTCYSEYWFFFFRHSRTICRALLYNILPATFTFFHCQSNFPCLVLMFSFLKMKSLNCTFPGQFNFIQYLVFNVRLYFSRTSGNDARGCATSSRRPSVDTSTTSSSTSATTQREWRQEEGPELLEVGLIFLSFSFFFF